MKKRTAFSLTFFAAIAVVSIVMVSCNKKFDAPPTYIPPNIQANTTIMALKNQYGSLGSSADSLLGDIIITGTVTADDQSGNFFKNIVIQDSTGGISIQLSGTNLYTSYNIGRQVWIKCKGLYIGNYNNSLMIGAGAGLSSTGKPIMEGIPSTLISQYVIAGDMVNNIKPTVVTASQLTTTLLNPLQNVLIELDNYQFSAADTLKTYADPTLVSTTAGTFYPQTCTGTNKTLELYNSNYASFAGLPVPTGNGPLLGIFTVYGTYPEIEIRDTSDVKFYGTRCGTSGGGGGGGTTNLITIAQLRAMYAGANKTITASTQITGVVISDAGNKNISTGDVIIQQGTNGISVYFGGTITYSVGDSVVIDITGATLTSYKGSLEIDPTSSTKPAPVATGKTIVPQVLTVAQLNAGLANPLSSASNIEYTLVTIQNITVSPAGPFYTAGVYPNLTDGNGKIELYTNKAATFGATTMPTTSNSWTGYGNLFNTTSQFMIRNLSDIN